MTSDTKISRRKYLKYVVGAAAGVAVATAGYGFLQPKSTPPATTTSTSVQSTLSKLQQDAQKDGKVVLYSGTSAPMWEAVMPAFEKKYGVKVEYLFLRPADLVTRFTEENRLGKNIVDVVDVHVNSMMFFQSQKLLQPHKGDGWDELLDQYKDKDGYWRARRVGMVGLAYNEKNVTKADAPTSWNDLLDSKWKNQIIMHDPRALGYGTAGYMGLKQLIGDNANAAFWKKLAAQQPRLETSGGGILNLIGRGEAKIGMFIPLEGALATKVSGLPVAPVENMEAFVDMAGIAVSANAPRPNAAKLFTQYVTSVEAQNLIVAADLNQPPANPKSDIIVGGMSLRDYFKKFKATFVQHAGFVMSDEAKEWEKLYFG